MTSDPHTQAVTPPPDSDTPPGTTDRLTLKPAGPRTGAVDGGWWPRSLDLVDELPALADALADRIGEVSRIAFALDGWTPAPRRSKLGARIVRLEGFRTQDTRVLHVTGATGTRLTLRLVPPGTAAGAAGTALRLAAGRTQEEPDQASNRWANDGGTTS